MFTGRALFDAPTQTETLAVFVSREPDSGAVSRCFHRLLRLCLAHDSASDSVKSAAARRHVDQEFAVEQRRFWYPLLSAWGSHIAHVDLD